MPRLKIDTLILGSNGTQVSEVILFKGSAKHQYPHISNVITLVHFVARKLAITYLMVLFILLLYVPSQQLWSLRDGQFT